MASYQFIEVLKFSWLAVLFHLKSNCLMVRPIMRVLEVVFCLTRIIEIHRSHSDHILRLFMIIHMILSKLLVMLEIIPSFLVFASFMIIILVFNMQMLYIIMGDFCYLYYFILLFVMDFFTGLMMDFFLPMMDFFELHVGFFPSFLTMMHINTGIEGWIRPMILFFVFTTAHSHFRILLNL